MPVESSKIFLSKLIDYAGLFPPSELDLKWLENVKTLGVTAGASAPEILVQELIQKLREVFEITLKELSQVREDVHFSLPNSLLN